MVFPTPNDRILWDKIVQTDNGEDGIEDDERSKRDEVGVNLRNDEGHM